MICLHAFSESTAGSSATANCIFRYMLMPASYSRSPSALVPERNGMSMTKQDLSSRHFQRKIPEFCEVRMAPIAPKRVLENIRPISLADYIPQTAADPKWPHRLDNDRDKRDSWSGLRYFVECIWVTSGASAIRSGTIGTWKAPVAATTFCASITPSDVSTRKPGRPTCLSTLLTSTPQRMGALQGS
ncbi:hypothetical protein ACVIKO_005710 [Rhizobium ruizarguesonis]